MKAKKISKKKTAKIKGGYDTSGRPGSSNIFNRVPGMINIGPNYTTWYDGTRRITSGVTPRSELGVNRSSSSGSGANRARSGRGGTL